MKKSIIIILAFFTYIFAQPGISAPNEISFQGMLTNADGSIYEDGEYQLTFRFIRTTQGESEQTIWEEEHMASVQNGVFSVLLGSITTLPQNIPGNAMLETQVGDEVLTPRQTFSSVPFSLKSNIANLSLQAVSSDTAAQDPTCSYYTVR